MLEHIIKEKVLAIVRIILIDFLSRNKALLGNQIMERKKSRKNPQFFMRLILKRKKKKCHRKNCKGHPITIQQNYLWLNSLTMREKQSKKIPRLLIFNRKKLKWQNKVKLYHKVMASFNKLMPSLFYHRSIIQLNHNQYFFKAAIAHLNLLSRSLMNFCQKKLKF